MNWGPNLNFDWSLSHVTSTMTLFVGNANQEVRTQLTVSTAVYAGQSRDSLYLQAFELLRAFDEVVGVTES